MPFILEHFTVNRSFLLHLGLVAAKLHEAVTAVAIARRFTVRVEIEIHPSIVFQAYSPFFKRNLCANEVQSIQACRMVEKDLSSDHDCFQRKCIDAVAAGVITDPVYFFIQMAE